MNTCLDALEKENVELLQQLRASLVKIEPDSYVAMHGPFRRGGIGKHVRHLLDHYHALLNPNGTTVDYESRERRPELETDPLEAVASIDSIISQLEDADVSRSVRAARHVWGAGEGIVDTSYERELQFLASHTVHHMALVAYVVEMLGLSVPETFGVAPSTLRHETRLKTGA